MQHKKISFIVIIVLLIIFVPLAIFTTTMRFINKKEIEEKNATKALEFKHDGKLYFYDNEDLIGTYTCNHFDDYCDYAKVKSEYREDFDDLKSETKEKIEVINNQYAFLIDSSMEKLATTEIILYDVKNETELNRFTELKETITGFIAKDENGLWGVLNFANADYVEVPFTYNYIGVPNNNSLTKNYYAVLEDGTWSIIDNNNIKLTTMPFSNIFTYNDNYIVRKEEGFMRLVNYDGTSKLDTNYNYLNFYDKYLVVVTTDNIFYLFDLEKEIKISRDFVVTNPSDINIEMEDGNIQIYIGEDLSETIAIE